MMYVAHIAWSIELIIVAAGFVIFHLAVKEKSSLLKTAALILIIGGVLGLGCSAYYSFKYWQDGSFETLMPMMAPNMMSTTGVPMHHMPPQE